MVIPSKCNKIKIFYVLNTSFYVIFWRSFCTLNLLSVYLHGSIQVWIILLFCARFSRKMTCLRHWWFYTSSHPGHSPTAGLHISSASESRPLLLAPNTMQEWVYCHQTVKFIQNWQREILSIFPPFRWKWVTFSIARSEWMHLNTWIRSNGKYI